MGLDQYAKTRDPKTGKVEEFKYWRKHNALKQENMECFK